MGNGSQSEVQRTAKLELVPGTYIGALLSILCSTCSHSNSPEVWEVRGVE